MRLYYTHNLNKLKYQLKNVKAQQAQLVLVTCETSSKLNNTDNLVKLLKNLYKHSSLLDPSLTLTKLSITQ